MSTRPRCTRLLRTLFLRTLLLRIGSVAAALVVLLPATALAAGGAGAPPTSTLAPDHLLVVNVSPSNGSAKSVTATCPPGMKVIGAGGEITDTGYAQLSGSGDGQVSITDMVPSADLRSVTVTAGIRDPLNWSFGVDTFTVTAQAQCARTLVAPVVTGLERVAGSSPSNGTSDSHKNATASCSAGKVLLGTGFTLSGANGKVFVNRVWPTGVMDGVTVDAYDDLLNATAQVALGDLVVPPAYNGVWDLKAFGVCADPGGAFTTVGGTDIGGGVSGTTTQYCPVGTVVTANFVDLQDEWAAGYFYSTAAIEALALGRGKTPPVPVPSQQFSTVRASIDQASDWVAYVYAWCQ